MSARHSGQELEFIYCKPARLISERMAGVRLNKPPTGGGMHSKSPTSCST